MKIKWHYDNPPEPTEDDETVYLVAINDTTCKVRYTDKAWYTGGGQWTDTFTDYMHGVYAWAAWPDAPPLEEES